MSDATTTSASVDNESATSEVAALGLLVATGCPVAGVASVVGVASDVVVGVASDVVVALGWAGSDDIAVKIGVVVDAALVVVVHGGGGAVVCGVTDVEGAALVRDVVYEMMQF